MKSIDSSWFNKPNMESCHLYNVTFLLIVKDITNERETFFKNLKTRNYFCVIPKNQGLHKFTAHISSNNSKSTNNTLLTETDYCYSNLSKILRWKKTCKKINEKNIFMV